MGKMFQVSLASVQPILDRITYKPGWSFDAEDDFGTTWLIVRMLVPNSRAPGQQWGHEKLGNDGFRFYSPRMPLIEVKSRYALNFIYPSERYFIEGVLYGFIANLERHEMQEWFKLDGELYDDPHKDDKPKHKMPDYNAIKRKVRDHDKEM